MQYGVHLPNSGPLASPEAIVTMATTAEQLGYDAVLIHDHVVWGRKDSQHNYAGSKELTDARGGPVDFYEAFTIMSYVAAVTKRVRLIPGALCLGWRPVGLMAREALTLHKLSGGRFVICVCVGDAQRDYDAMGMPWENRGKTMVENLKALRAVIDSDSPVSFRAGSASVQNEEWMPRLEGLKLWYAGVSDTAVKRAARYCDGWMGEDPCIFKTKAPMLREEAEKAGRGDVKFEFTALEPGCIAETDQEAYEISRATLEVHTGGQWLNYMYPPSLGLQPRKDLLIGSPRKVMDGVRQYQEAGVTLLNMHFIAHSLGSILQQMETFAREVMPHVK